MPNHLQQIMISNAHYIFFAVVWIIHIDGIVVFFVLFLWTKFVLFTNELNSRYGYNFTIRKIAFVWYYEVLYVLPLAGEHIAFSSLGSITFYDFGLPEISPIFIKLSLWYRMLVDPKPITVCHKY